MQGGRFLGEWRDMDPSLAETLRKILPAEIEKCSVYYDLAKSPGKYVDSTRRICNAMGKECKVHLLPSRRSWVPCHIKFDTESILEMFIPYKRRMEWRKSFGEDKKALVWGKLLRIKVVKSKSRSFTFHHKITTDGVAVSLLYSRIAAGRDTDDAPTMTRGIQAWAFPNCENTPQDWIQERRIC